MTALLPPPQTGDLFTEALLGCPDALDLLLRQHRPAVEAVCFRRLRSRTDAEDAVQETMLRGMKALDNVEDPARLKSYLCRIAERVCLDMLRAGAVAMPYVVEDTPSNDAAPEEVALENERARLVHQTLEALSERQATALWMRDALGESVPVVAERLGVTEGSARVLLTRARAKMRDGWAKVAAIIPGAGLKFPSLAAKVLHVGPLAIPAAIPAALLIAAVAVSPVAFQAITGGDTADMNAASSASTGKGTTSTPSTTTTTITPPSAADARAATTTGDRAASPSASTTRTPVAPVGGAVPTATAEVGDSQVGLSERETNPDEDDDSVTIGPQEVIQLGGEADDLKGMIENGQHPADPSFSHTPSDAPVSVQPQ